MTQFLDRKPDSIKRIVGGFYMNHWREKDGDVYAIKMKDGRYLCTFVDIDGYKDTAEEFNSNLLYQLLKEYAEQGTNTNNKTDVQATTSVGPS